MYIHTSEGVAQPIPPSCKPEPDEVTASHTPAGILPKDVEITDTGALVTDFGIDRRSVKSRSKSELAALIHQLETDPAIAEIRISGYSDCIGSGGARYHTWLRRERARRVRDLLGQVARAKVRFVSPASIENFRPGSTSWMFPFRWSWIAEYLRELCNQPSGAAALFASGLARKLMEIDQDIINGLDAFKRARQQFSSIFNKKAALKADFGRCLEALFKNKAKTIYAEY